MLSALTESNIIGSIILSSIILKIALIGFIRYCILYNYLNSIISNIYLICGIISIIINSFYCLITIDIKRIIAYCSVILMSIILISLILNSMLGSILIGITLSIISSSLFYIVSCLYMVYLSKNIYYFKYFKLSFILNSFFFYFILSNISFPFTCSFIPEIIIFNELFNSLGHFVIFIIITCLLTSILSLFFYNKIFFLLKSIHLHQYLDLNRLLTFNLLLFFLLNSIHSFHLLPITTLILHI